MHVAYQRNQKELSNYKTGTENQIQVTPWKLQQVAAKTMIQNLMFMQYFIFPSLSYNWCSLSLVSLGSWFPIKFHKHNGPGWILCSYWHRESWLRVKYWSPWLWHLNFSKSRRLRSAGSWFQRCEFHHWTWYSNADDMARDWLHPLEF